MDILSLSRLQGQTVRTFLAGAFFVLAFLSGIPTSHAVVYFYRGGVAGAALSDSFERTANWSTKPRGLADGSVPGAADIAVFSYSGTTVRLRSPAKIGGIVFASTWTGSFIYGTGSLTVGTSGIRIGSGTFLGGNASSLLHNSGSLVMTGGVVTNLAGTFNQSGSLSIMSVSNSKPQFTLTGTLVLRPNGTVNTLEIGKHNVTAVIRTLTMTASNSARVRSTGSGMSLSGALTINSGILDLTKSSTAQPLVVKGGMTLANDAAAQFLTGNAVTLSGSLTIGASSTWTATGGTFTLSGDNPQTLTLNGGAKRFNNLTINNTGTAGTQNRIFIAGNGLFASGALTVTAGTLDLMTNSQALAVKGGITLANAAAAVLKTRSDVTMSGSMTIGANSTFTMTGGTLTFNSDNPQTITINPTTQRFNNVTLNNTASTNARNGVTFAGQTVSLSGSVTVTRGTWNTEANGIAATIRGGITVAESATARFFTDANLTVSGSITVKPLATFTQSGGTTELDGTSAQTLSGSMTFSTLKKIQSATLSFYPGYTYTMSTLNTHGASASSKLTMNSSVSGQRWNINPTTASTITHVALQDSKNSSGLNQKCLDCTNNGNNEDWQFETSASTSSTTTTTSSGGSSGGRSTAASAALKGTAQKTVKEAEQKLEKKIADAKTRLQRRIDKLKKALEKRTDAKSRNRLERVIKILSRRLK